MDEKLYESIEQAAKRWGITRQRVSQYLQSERIPGAIKGNQTVWRIPISAEHPKELKRGRKPKVTP